jgi:regulator of nonsense transcripts 1
MIQFSKPRRTLAKSIDQYRRHDTSAREYLGNTAANSGTPSRFDASFYRTHDPLNYIPSDVQSLRSQATYSSGLPVFNTSGPFNAGGVGKRSAYGSYAPSIVSQGGAGDSGSVIGGVSERVGYAQSDRLRRRGSFGSVAGASEVGSLLSSGFDYKSQDEAADMDDMKSQYAATQSGVTAF